MSKLLNLENLCSYADNAFGENNWSYTITNQVIDYVDETETTIAISCTTSTKFYVTNNLCRESIGTSTIVSDDKLNAFRQVRQTSFRESLQKYIDVFKKIRSEIEKESRDYKSKKRCRNFGERKVYF
ncbi:hypothetical protein KQX54_005219 [Cotesia glomerata]|uniref:Uncharacterized protein n=1 Tax=Cotesia glomerata TaxID=32391 RepID=A0AAV7IHW2_COTGL|nr:hypothetical protein KQX54_005219 [Cotesia glomerata]